MMNYREFQALPEWVAIEATLQKLFQHAITTAVEETKDIGEVRYNKGRIDVINEVLALPAQLFADPGEVKEEDLSEPEGLIITSRRGDQVY